MRMPSLYVTHGAPTLPLDPGPARDFLQGLGDRLGRPRAILAVSAHWATREPAVSMAAQPRTIHDFGGFPDELYRLQYPAPGAPELARRVTELLGEAGLPCGASSDRGLDHGAWVPLMLMYPGAEIPVTQLSIQPQRDPRHHFAVGKALAPLQDEGVLIVASGSATHNLHEFRGQGPDSPSPAWVTEFAEWLDAAVAEGRTDDLLDYRARAPHAVRNHPTDEHLLPLYVAMGAGGKGSVLHGSYTYGILYMGAYAFA